ncbi:rod shape-determining protein MreC [Candidatus Sneabacter namystus]|uniref:Rod shape-determining protein MreC beta-barrel core domain-containing protein n=1 Tax=Candidatus Sneabacter namystus TaxID=2601646 RepID=A0A5C0UHH7_9RICK|nr:rod shape-determining protein MreC [Candidatus Sneabacter namystus]QEK39605.1 hypothetical protein FZC37_01485 [Candidatus Sneabacter namystus]
MHFKIRYDEKFLACFLFLFSLALFFLQKNTFLYSNNSSYVVSFYIVGPVNTLIEKGKDNFVYCHYCVKNFLSVFRHNVALTKELQQANRYKFQVRQLSQENRMLRHFAGIMEQDSAYYLASKIFFVTSSSGHHCALISVDSDSSIAIGQLVVDLQHAVVGKVEGLYKHYAVVLLVSDIGFKMISYLPDLQCECVVEGCGNGYVKVIDKTGKDIQCVEGSVVFSAKDNSNSLSGIPIAQLTRDSYNNLCWKPIANFSTNRLVGILQNNKMSSMLGNID